LLFFFTNFVRPPGGGGGRGAPIKNIFGGGGGELKATGAYPVILQRRDYAVVSYMKREVISLL